jgi:hypothetical protein
LLREIGGTTQFAQRSHDGHTMPRGPRVVKATSAYQAGDHDVFSEYLPCAKLYDGRKRAENGDRKMREFWRELARLITLFDEASPANISASEIREFSRKCCARRDSNAGPPA